MFRDSPGVARGKKFFLFLGRTMWLPPRSNEFIRFVGLFCTRFYEANESSLN